ncbi:MAG: AbrB/MazE/SpoVT family DNA-binding domain-containing protein [Chloroflexota bacterium]
MTTVNTYPIKLRERGQLTIPQAVREQLATKKGDLMTLVQIDDLIILTPKTLKLPALADKFSQMMEEEGVSLADLLEGLAEERQRSYETRLENDD